ncbi:MAG: protein disulfide oxidoreductase [Psychromonas sp.]
MSKETLKKGPKGWFSWLKEALLLILIIVIIVIISAAIDLWRSQSMLSGSAPNLVAQSVSGEKIDLITMSQEKPVLVYFWATWCAVCRSVSPSVNFISEHYQVVTIALTSGESPRVQQYLNAKQYDFNVLNDPKGEISRAWSVSVTPTIFVINKGEISSITTGFTSPIGMWLRLLLA